MTAAGADRPHIEPLAKAHDRSAFSCGAPELDRYLKTQARQDARRRVAAPFVLVDPERGTVAGYYTLSSCTIHLDDLPPGLSRKLPRYPALPATLLGRLAVDERHRGRGYGELLLVDALRRSLEQTAEIASWALVVDARDDAAGAFYAHFGFQPLPGQPGRLFISMDTVAALFR